MLDSKSEELSKSEKKCKELSSKCKQLGAKCKQVMESSSEKEARISNLEQQLAETNSRLEEKVAEVETVQNEYTKCKQDLLSSSEKAEEELSDRNDELNNLRKELSLSRELCDQVTAGLSTERARREAVKGVCEALVQIYEAKEDEIQRLLEAANEKASQLAAEEYEWNELLQSMKTVVIAHAEKSKLLSDANRRIDELSTQVGEDESEKVKLQEGVENLQNEVNRLRAEIVDKDARVDQLIGELGELSSSVETCQRENGSLSQVVKEKEELLEQRVKENSELENVLSLVKTSEETLKAQLTEVETSVENLKREKESLLMGIEVARREVVEKEAKLETVTSALSEKDGSISGIVEEANRLRTSLSDSERNLEIKDKEMEEQRKSLEEYTAKVSDLEGQLSKLERQCEEHGVMKLELMNQITCLDEEVKAARRTIENAEGELAESRKTIANLNEDLASKEQKIEELTVSLTNLSVVSSESSNDLERVRNEYEDAIKKLADERCKVRQIVEELSGRALGADQAGVEQQQLVQNNESSSGIASDVEYSSNELRELVKTKRNEIVQKTEELSRCKEEMEKLASSLSVQENSFREASAKIAELEQTLDSKSEELSKSEKKCKELSSKCKQLGAKCKQVMESSSEKEARISNLEQQLAETNSRLEEKVAEVETVQNEYTKCKQDLLSSSEKAEEELSGRNDELNNLRKELSLSRELCDQVTAGLSTERARREAVKGVCEALVQIYEAKEDEIQRLLEAANEKASQLAAEEYEWNELLQSMKTVVIAHAEKSKLLSDANRRIDELSTQVGEDESEKVKLQEGVENLQNEVNRLRAEIVDKDARVDQLIGELGELSSSVETCQRENGSLSQVVKEKEELLEQRVKENSELENVLSLVKTSEETLKARLTEVETSVENLKREKESLLMDIEVARREVVEKEVKLETVTSALSEKDGSISGIVEEANRLRTSLSDSERNLEIKDKEMEEQRKSLEEYTAKVSDLEGQLSKLERQCEEHGVMKLELMNQITCLDEEVKAARRTIENAEGELAESRKTIANLNEDLASKEQKIEELTVSLTNLSVVSSESSNDLERVRNEYEDAIKKLADERCKVRQIVEELSGRALGADQAGVEQQQLVQNNESSSGIASDVEYSSNELRELVKTKRNEIVQKTEELSRCKEEMEKLASSLSVQENSFREASAKIAELEQTLDSKSEELSKSEKKCKELSSKCKQLGAKCKQVMESSSEKEARISNLEQQLAETNSRLEEKVAEVETVQNEYTKCKQDLLSSSEKAEEELSGRNDELNNLRKELSLSRELCDQVTAGLSTERARREAVKGVCEALVQIYEAKEDEIQRLLEAANEKASQLAAEEYEWNELLQSMKTVVIAHAEKSKLLSDANRRIDELSTQVGEDESEKVKLQEGVENLQNEVNRLRAEIVDKDARVDQLIGELGELSSSVETCQRENGSLSQVVKEKEELLEQRVKENSELENVLSLVKTSEETLKAQLTEVETSVENLKREKESLLMDIEVARREVVEKEAKLETVTSALSEKDGSISGIVEEANRLRTSLSDSERNLEIKDKEMEEQRKSLEEYTAKVSDLEGQLSKLERQCEEHGVMKLELMNQITCLDEEVKAARRTIENAEGELAESRKTIANLNEDLASKEQKIEELTVSLTNLSVVSSESSNDLERVRNEYEDAIKKLADERCKVRQIVEELSGRALGADQAGVEQQQLVQNNESSSGIASDVEYSSNELRELVKTKRNEIVQKTEELSRCKEEMEKLASSLSVQENSFREASAKIAELEQTLDSKSEELSKSEKKCKELSSKCKQLGAKCKQVMESSSEKEARISNLEQQLAETNSRLEEKVAEVETVQNEYTKCKQDLLSSSEKAEEELSGRNDELNNLRKELSLSRELCDQVTAGLSTERARREAVKGVCEALVQIYEAKEDEIQRLLEAANEKASQLAAEEYEWNELLQSMKTVVIAHAEKSKLLSDANRRIDELSTQVGEDESEKVKLQEGVENLQNEVNRLRAEIVDKDARVDQLIGELGELSSSVETCQRENGSLSQVVKEKEELLEQRVKENSELENVLSLVKTSEETLKARLTEVETSVENLKREKESLLMGIEVARREVVEKEAKLETVTSALSEKDGSISGIVEEANRLRTSLSDSERNLEIKDKEMEEQRKSLEEYTAKVSDLEGQLSKLERQCEEHGVMKLELMNQITCLDEEVKAARRTIENAEGELAESRKTIANLNEDLASKEQKIEELTVSLTNLSVVSSESSNDLERVRNEYEDAIKKLADERCKVRQIVEELSGRALGADQAGVEQQQLVQNNESSSGIASDVEYSSNELRELVKTKRNEIVQKTEELSNCKEEMEKLASSLSVQENSFREASAKIAELGQMLRNRSQESEGGFSGPEIARAGVVEKDADLEAVTATSCVRDASVCSVAEGRVNVSMSFVDTNSNLDWKDKEIREQRVVLEQYTARVSDLESQLMNYQQLCDGHGIMTMGLLSQITFLTEELQVARNARERVGEPSNSYETDTHLSENFTERDGKLRELSYGKVDDRNVIEPHDVKHQMNEFCGKIAGLYARVRMLLDEFDHAQKSRKTEHAETCATSLSEAVKGSIVMSDLECDDVHAAQCQDTNFVLFDLEIEKLTALITSLDLSARQSLNEAAELRQSLDRKTDEVAESHARCEELSEKCKSLAATCNQLLETSSQNEVQIKQLDQYMQADDGVSRISELIDALQLQQEVDTAVEKLTADGSLLNLESSYVGFPTETVREPSSELRPSADEAVSGDMKQTEFLECRDHLEVEERCQELKLVSEHERNEQDVFRCRHCNQQLPLDLSALPRMELRLQQYEKDVMQCVRKVPTEWISVVSSLKLLDDELLDIASLTASAAAAASNVCDGAENGATALSTDVTNEGAHRREMFMEMENADTKPIDLCRCVVNDISSHMKAVRFQVEHKLQVMTDMAAELSTLSNRLTSVHHQLEDKDDELSNARLAVQAGEIKFEKLKAKSISKLKELTANHQISLEQKHAELNELKRQLNERTTEANRFDEDVKKLQKELEESEKLGNIARKRVEELQVLVETKNEQLLLLTEKLTTDVAGGDEFHQASSYEEGTASSRSLANTGTSQVDCRVGHEFIDVDRYRNLETCLNRAKRDLSNLLDVGNETGADVCEELLLLVERSSQLVSSLKLELSDKEAKMSLAVASAGEKEALAKKYAVAAKKLKQQVEELKKRASFADDQDEKAICSSQMSKVETESSETESKLKLLESALEEKELRISALLQEITALTESRTAEKLTDAKKIVEDSKEDIAIHEAAATLTEDGETQFGFSKSAADDEEVDGVETPTTAGKSVGETDEYDRSLAVNASAMVESSVNALARETAPIIGEDEVETLKRQIDVLNAQLVDSESQLAKMRNEYDDIAVRSEGLNAIIDDYEKQLQDKEAVWKHEHETSKAQSVMLEEAYSQKASELETQRQRVEDLEQQVLALNVLIAEKDAVISDSARHCSSSESEVRSLTEQIDALREEMERYRDECERRLNVIAEKEVQLVQSSDSAKESVNRENKLKAVIKKMKSQMEQMKTGAIAYEEQLSQLTAEKERVDAQLSEFETRLTDIGAKLAAAETKIQEQNEQLGTKDVTIAEANDCLQREKEMTTSQAEELEQTCKELQNLRRDYALLESRFDETSSSLNRQVSSGSERNALLEHQVAEKDRQLQEFDEKVREFEPLVSVVDTLQSKIDQQESLLVECSSKISQLTSENRDLVRRLEAVGSSLEEVEASSFPVCGPDAGDPCKQITEENFNREATTDALNQAESVTANAAETSAAVDCVSSGVRPSAEVIDVTVDSDFGLVELRSQLETLFKANSKLQNSLEERGMKVDTYAAENARLEQLNDQLLAEVNQLKSHLADVEVEVCSLKTELSEQKNPAGGQSVANIITEQIDKLPEFIVDLEGSHDRQKDHTESSSVLPESSQCRLFADQLMNVRVESEVSQRSSASESVTLQQLEDVERRCAAVELERNSLLKELRYEKDKNANLALAEIRLKSVEEENKNYAVQIESMSSMKEKMLTKLKQLKDANDHFRLQVERLEKQADDAAAALGHAETDRQVLHAECELLREQLSIAEKKAKEARSEADRKQQEMLAADENHCASLEALQGKINGFEFTVLEKQEQLVAKEAEVIALSVEMEQVKSLLAACQAEMESSVSAYEQRIAGLVMENNNLTNSIEKLQGDLSESQESSARKLADMKLLHDTVMNDAESLQDVVQQLAAEKGRLEQAMKENCSSAEKLKAELDALRMENADVLLEREKLGNRLEELEKSFADEKQDYEDSMKDLSGSTAALESELELAHRNSASLQEKIDGMNWKIQELSEIEEELQQLQNELFAVQSENGMLKKKLNSMERDLVDREHKIDDANAALLDEKAGLLAEIAQMKSELTRTSELVRASSEAATSKQHRNSHPGATQTEFGGTDAATQCVDDCDDAEERLRTALATTNDELVRAKAENLRLQSTVAGLQSDRENLQTSLATYERQYQRSSLARPALVDQCVQTSDWRNDRKAVPWSRKREVSWKI
jgi:chromosome segregation ATPase